MDSGNEGLSQGLIEKARTGKGQSSDKTADRGILLKLLQIGFTSAGDNTKTRRFTRPAIELILHIGTEKTGTTTAQKWFARNRAALAAQGVWYPRSLQGAGGSLCHRLLPVTAVDFADADEAFRIHGLDTAEKHAQFSADVARRFKDEVAKAGGHDRWLISSEHLHSRVNSVEKVARVRRFLEPYFTKTTVYIHLRPQIDMAVSLASTGARTGVIIGPETFTGLRATSTYYNYLDLVTRWSQVFGAQNLVVIPYRRQPDFREVIAAALGLDITAFEAVEQANTGLDWQVIALLNQLQREGRSHLAKRLIRTGAIEALPRNQPLRIGLDMARTVQSRFDRSNAELITRLDSLAKGDLDPDWERFNATPNIDLLSDDMAIPEPVSALIANMASMIVCERLAGMFASAERALARGNKGHARGFLRTATKLAADLDPALDDPETVASLLKRLNRLQRKAALKL